VVDDDQVDSHLVALVAQSEAMLCGQIQTSEGSLDLADSNGDTSCSCRHSIAHNARASHTRYGSYHSVRNLWRVQGTGTNDVECGRRMRKRVCHELKQHHWRGLEIHVMVSVD